MRTIRVAVQASDRIGLAGLTSLLASRPEFAIVAGPDCDVVVVAVERAGPQTVALLPDRVDHPVVLVAAEVPGGELLRLVGCGVVAILPRRGVTGERVLAAVLAAAGGGATMPPRLLADLLCQVGRLQREVLAPQRLNACGMTAREVDVLRLMADGWDTEDIADRLRYSTRTVKNLVYALTSRLGLRNRAHAVAYALDAGII